jgi:hypothetical protein
MYLRGVFQRIVSEARRMERKFLDLSPGRHLQHTYMKLPIIYGRDFSLWEELQI